jgi:hypothetical protein
VVPLHVRQRIRAANLAEVEMPLRARARLADLYAPDVERLHHLLGEIGPAWLRGASAR